MDPSPLKKFCFACGQQIDSRAEICPKCGVRQPAQQTQAQGRRSRLAAGLFALFLGGLGIHKFYLGSIGWGIIYLVFCWTFIPAVVGIIEGIVRITMPDSAFAERYDSPPPPSSEAEPLKGRLEKLRREIDQVGEMLNSKK